MQRRRLHQARPADRHTPQVRNYGPVVPALRPDGELSADQRSGGDHHGNGREVRRTLHALCHIHHPHPERRRQQLGGEGRDIRQSVRQRFGARPFAVLAGGLISGVDTLAQASRGCRSPSRTARATFSMISHCCYRRRPGALLIIRA
jgi:hypothetical protein